MRGEAREVNDEIYAELTYHAAYDPQRAVRRRAGQVHPAATGRATCPVLPNIDDSPSKDFLLRAGLAERPRPREELYDLTFDPNEAHNLAGDPLHREVHADLAQRLDTWMRATDDPLLHGDVLPPPGAEVNDPAGVRRPSCPRRERRGPLVERGGELAARLARERVLDAELVEDADDGAPEVLAPVASSGVRRSRRSARRGRARCSPRVERGERARPARRRSSRRSRAARPSAAKSPGSSSSSASASSRSPRAAQDARQRDGGVRAAWLELQRAPQVVLAARGDQRVGLGRDERVEEARDHGRRLRAGELGRRRAPSLNALTAGMPWIRKAAASRWLASVSTLASATWPSRSLTACSSTGVSWRQGPHHAAQKSTTTGSSRERSMTSCSKVASVASKITLLGYRA